LRAVAVSVGFASSFFAGAPPFSSAFFGGSELQLNSSNAAAIAINVLRAIFISSLQPSTEHDVILSEAKDLCI